jgi:hypothetical protein
VILLSLWAVPLRTRVVDPFSASSPSTVAVCWPPCSPMGRSSSTSGRVTAAWPGLMIGIVVGVSRDAAAGRPPDVAVFAWCRIPSCDRRIAATCDPPVGVPLLAAVPCQKSSGTGEACRGTCGGTSTGPVS